VTFQAGTTPRPTRDVINMLSLRPRLRRWTRLAIGSLLLRLTAGCSLGPDLGPSPAHPHPSQLGSGSGQRTAAIFKFEGLPCEYGSISAPPAYLRGSPIGRRIQLEPVFGADRIEFIMSGLRPTEQVVLGPGTLAPHGISATLRDSGPQWSTPFRATLAAAVAAGATFGGDDFGSRKGQIRWLECHNPRRQRGLGIRRQPDRYLVWW
jgi:hypothetical protein